jgi:hypothetical protein
MTTCRIPICAGTETDRPGVNCVPPNQLNDTVDLLGKHHFRHLFCCDTSSAVEPNSGFFADN